MTSVLVTGAAGFIGSRLVRALRAGGREVRAVDSFTDYGGVDRKRFAAAALASDVGVTVDTVDLAAEPLAPLMQGIDVVFHLAGQPGVRQSWGEGFGDYARDNVVATQRVVDAAMACSVDRLVYASSSSIYGNALTHPTVEDTLPRPVSPYGVTKLTGEHICAAYASSGGPATIALRYFTVYGPGQRPDMALHRLFASALGGPPFPLYGDGTQIRDLTYVDDIVDATVAAGAASTAGFDVVNVAGGTQISLGELITLVAELVGRSPVVEPLSVVTGDVERTSASVDRAQRLLDWSASVAVRDGLERQLEWHRTVTGS